MASLAAGCGFLATVVCFLLLTTDANAAVVPYSLNLNQWDVDYMRPTSAPRLGSYSITDAAKTQMLLANNTYPGPAISVNEGDTINVTVTNNIIMYDVSMVFEGVQVVKGSDAQIKPQGGMATYELLASKAGTFSWHASVDLLSQNGLRGAVVVHSTNSSKPTMEEKLVVLSDARQRSVVCYDGNGEWDSRMCPNIDKAHINGQWGDGSKLYPLPVIQVKEGSCYQLRLLGFAPQATDMFELWIQDHDFSVLGATTSIVKVASNAEGMEATLCANQHPIVDHDYKIWYTLANNSSKVTFVATLTYV